jgi:hypothetical protein
MMNASSKLDFKRISLVIAIVYAICVAVLLGLYVKEFFTNTKLIRLFALWVWIIGPQLILSQYVSKFLTRWAKLISLLLQIPLFIFSLYKYGVYALDYDDVQPEALFLLLPIWHYVTIAIVGLVMKIIESY